MPVREPAVAGMFYPARSTDLRKQIESCFLGAGGPGRPPIVNKDGRGKITALVSPHAGYVYSGSTAAWAYLRLAEDGLPNTAVLIGPNHRSYHPAVALSDDEAWRTPLGQVQLDAGTAAEIAAAWNGAKVDAAAHRGEHSLEVQLPFLQYLAELGGADIRIVPILIGSAARQEVPGGERALIEHLGGALAEVLRDKNAAIIASTDFTHYETAESARAKDQSAISCILDLDAHRLLDTVDELDISMCGVLPTAAALVAGKAMGAVSARELAYSNSGDVTGDYAEVVGYAALEIDR